MVKFCFAELMMSNASNKIGSSSMKGVSFPQGRVRISQFPLRLRPLFTGRLVCSPFQVEMQGEMPRSEKAVGKLSKSQSRSVLERCSVDNMNLALQVFAWLFMTEKVIPLSLFFVMLSPSKWAQRNSHQNKKEPRVYIFSIIEIGAR